ncbi:hypothetical protein [Algisphaera agarilytica]|uniref:Uncharacterized protein n=1 Tax=Algisphaera agarilytica TaxID=1385975 RepID=A0A7X0LKM5_9BACT|nr:hypothetical protein [Algisphaera agarilytica]MBB6429108.1 hypothetical protein [Algisphaera agarilytica]
MYAWEKLVRLAPESIDIVGIREKEIDPGTRVDGQKNLKWLHIDVTIMNDDGAAVYIQIGLNPRDERGDVLCAGLLAV